MGGRLNTQEQKNDARIGNVLDQEQTFADTTATRGGRAVKHGEKALGTSLDFYKSILSGDRESISQILSPEMSRIRGGAESAKKNIAEYGARGGGSVAAATNVENQAQAQENEAVLKARPEAADKMSQIGQTLASLGLSEEQLAQSGLGQILSMVLGENQLEIERKQTRSGVGAALGKLAGGLIGKFLPGFGT